MRTTPNPSHAPCPHLRLRLRLRHRNFRITGLLFGLDLLRARLGSLLLRRRLFRLRLIQGNRILLGLLLEVLQGASSPGLEVVPA